MKNITVKFYTDPSHGWFAVKRNVLKELNLLDKISSYSYTKGKTVYLEEDCDATLFFHTAEKQSLDVVIKGTFHTDKSHPIRSYDRYTYCD